MERRIPEQGRHMEIGASTNGHANSDSRPILACRAARLCCIPHGHAWQPRSCQVKTPKKLSPKSIPRRETCIPRREMHVSRRGIQFSVIFLRVYSHVSLGNIMRFRRDRPVFGQRVGNTIMYMNYPTQSAGLCGMA